MTTYFPREVRQSNTLRLKSIYIKKKLSLLGGPKITGSVTSNFVRLLLLQSYRKVLAAHVAAMLGASLFWQFCWNFYNLYNAEISEGLYNERTDRLSSVLVSSRAKGLAAGLHAQSDGINMVFGFNVKFGPTCLPLFCSHRPLVELLMLRKPTKSPCFLEDIRVPFDCKSALNIKG